MPFESQYTDSEKQAALELAAAVGVRAASRQLGVQRKTIYRWVEKFPQLWSDLRAGDPQAGRRKVAQRLEDLADRYAAAEHDLLEKIEDGEIEAGDAKEAAALLKAMGSSRQASIAGSRTMNGEPDQTHELNINFPAIEAAMEKLLGGGGNPPTPATLEAEYVELPLRSDD